MIAVSRLIAPLANLDCAERQLYSSAKHAGARTQTLSLPQSRGAFLQGF